MKKKMQHRDGNVKKANDFEIAMLKHTKRRNLETIERSKEMQKFLSKENENIDRQLESATDGQLPVARDTYPYLNDLDLVSFQNAVQEGNRNYIKYDFKTNIVYNIELKQCSSASAMYSYKEKYESMNFLNDDKKGESFQLYLQHRALAPDVEMFVVLSYSKDEQQQHLLYKVNRDKGTLSRMTIRGKETWNSEKECYDMLAGIENAIALERLYKTNKISDTEYINSF